jgi:S-sulfosulfanyl-L-cysteine sulfohydrolase
LKHLTILQINDLHGYLAPHPEMFRLPESEDIRLGGGLERIAALFAALRRDHSGAVLALDNGDTFHGTMAAVQTQGKALLAPMRALRLDAMTAHWEFAYGLAGVAEIARGLPYPMLAANYRAPASALKLPPLTIVDRGGVKVAVIGLSAIVATQLLPQAQRSLVEMAIGEAELQAMIPSIRRDHPIDLVVVLSHLGFPQDCKLAALVPGIDVLLSGHTHNRLDRPAMVNDTIIMQSGAHGSFVGRLDLTLAGDGIAEWSHALIAVDDSIEPDGEMTALVAEALRPFANARASVIGEATCTLHRYSMFESTMDNLLLDATAAAAGTHVALSNGWRYGAPIAAGPLTKWDVWNIVPANPPISIVTLTGRELRDLFEQNVEATFAYDPWQQRGGYLKRCHGLELLLKLENPLGHRVQQLTISGEDLLETQTIEVAFLGEQAVPAHVGANRRAVGVSAVEALEQHVRTHDAVVPELRGNIRVV